MDHRRYLLALSTLCRPIALTLLCILASGCENEGDMTFSNTIDTPSFTIQTPAGWTFTRHQGYDSYTGQVSGPFGTLHFDQGFFAQNTLHLIRETEHTVYLQRVLVNGDSAVLRKERSLDANGKATLTMHIQEQDGVRSNRLYVVDPSPLSERIMTEIMMTHRFK